MRGSVSIQIDLLRPGRSGYLDRLAKELLRRTYSSICAEQRMDGLAVSIDGPINVLPAASNEHRGLVRPPGRMGRPCQSRPASLKFRHVMLHPAHNGRVAHGHITLGHHGGEVAIAQPVRYVPADAEFDEFCSIAAPTIDGVAGSGSGDSGPPLEIPIIGSTVNAPEPEFTRFQTRLGCDGLIRLGQPETRKTLKKEITEMDDTKCYRKRPPETGAMVPGRDVELGRKCL